MGKGIADKVAIIDGDVRLTYAEFDAAVNRCANALTARGLSRGDRLALISHNSWQFAVLNFACARIGAILVPINFGLGVSEIAFILDHSQASGVVVEDALGPTVIEAIETAGTPIDIRGWIPLAGTQAPRGFEPVAEWMTTGDASAPGVVIDDDEPVRMMYTSGTESRPKGVLLSSKSLMTQYVSCIVDGGMEGSDVEIHALPMYHCAQLDCFFSVDVYLGATSIILHAPDAATMLATIEAERVTKLFCPPTVWISLLRHPDFDTRDLSSLRKGYYGAAAMPVEVLRELARRLPDVRLWNFYGQTEMSPLATILQPHEQLDRAGSAGRAALNVETRVVDDEDNPVPVGEVGEIVYRGSNMMLGYWQNPQGTQDAFRGGWFHSGDLVRRDDEGFLYVVDRAKDMIISGGENIYCAEVENVLYGHPRIVEAAVIGRADPKWGEVPVAVVVTVDGADLTLEEMEPYLDENLARFKQPKDIVLVEELPRNAGGKVVKPRLRESYGSKDEGLAN